MVLKSASACDVTCVHVHAGLIAPPPFLELLVNGGARPAQVERALQAAFWKALALLAAGAAVGVALAAKGCRLAYAWWRSWQL